MDINGTTRVCGLIGNPVAHSISPVIHNRLAGLRGDNFVYATFKVEAGNVAAAVKGAYALDILGLNVTVPHKQAVIDELVDIDELAAAIGAVNTLVRTEGGFKGYNTDILGLDRELSDVGISLEDKCVVIIGAGGAARAIAFLCAGKKASELYIMNRTLEKAQNIADAVNEYAKKDIAKAAGISECGSFDKKDYIVIQTTSVGLHPHDDETAVTADEFYENAAAGVDIIYNPYETMFMKLMKKHGKPAYNGLKMLLYQGVAAYELWNDCKISSDMADIIYEDMKKELGISE